MKNITPDKEYLCEIFHYDEHTGRLTWRKPTSPRAKVGDEVGYTSQRGYRVTKVMNGRYRVHRLIYKMMTGEEPDEVDHINNIKDDNRWLNLRSVTRQENQLNRIDSKRNGGVKWHNHRRTLKTCEGA